jgi:chorismate mutase
MSTDVQGDKRLRALRGATTVETNSAPEIVEATRALLTAMVARNDVDLDDVVSVIFTATADLDAEFPAAAARALGIGHVPLLCAREIDVPGDVARCIRVLMHLYTTRDHAGLRHVYLGEARQLRTDLPE